MLNKAAFLACVLVAANCAPADCLSSITLTGQVQPLMSISGSPNCGLINAQPGSAITCGADQPGPVTGSVNFGNLAAGNGADSVASFGLRVRGNCPCHVCVAVSAYQASGLKYNGIALTGQPSELAFIKLGAGVAKTGASGDSSGMSYGSKFASGADTLATLNSGAMGAVTATSDRLASFASKPSRSGAITSADNYVEATMQLATPTGFGWESTNGSGSFSVTTQFEIFPGG